jgi:Domain of unknown function (DUF4384)
MRIYKILIASLFPMVLGVAHAQEVMPRDLSVEQSNAWSLNVSRPGSVRISLNADRADATYAIGETARLFIRANEDAYVNVFAIGPSGKVHQLFPNAYQRDSRVRANHPVEIAPSVSGARITVRGPVGNEVVKVVASNKPLVGFAGNQGREFFPTIDGGVPELARNLEVVGTGQSAAETSVVTQNYAIRTVPYRSASFGQYSPAVGTNVLAPAQAPSYTWNAGNAGWNGTGATAPAYFGAGHTGAGVIVIMPGRPAHRVATPTSISVMRPETGGYVAFPAQPIYPLPMLVQ